MLSSGRPAHPTLPLLVQKDRWLPALEAVRLAWQLPAPETGW